MCQKIAKLSFLVTLSPNDEEMNETIVNFALCGGEFIFIFISHNFTLFCGFIFAKDCSEKLKLVSHVKNTHKIVF